MSARSTYQVPEYIRSLVPYVPGKPIEETQREYGLKRVIKLASNENPLGPSPRARLAARSELKDLHRYPDGSGYHLKAELAKFHSRPSDRVAGHRPASTGSLWAAQNFILGNGSNEIIDFLVRTFALPGDAIVTSQAAFIAYPLCAQIHGVRTVAPALTPDYRFDLDAILEAVRRDAGARLVFIANPNNPTGTYVPDDELRAFLGELRKVRNGSVVAVLDYAYWEYVRADDLSDPLALIRDFANVIVLRTFSKVYGLAGLRIGYAMADAEIIASLEKVRQPFNISSVALAAGRAALKDQVFVRKARAANREAMKFWEGELTRMGIPFWPSQGNFILIDTQLGLGMAGSSVYEACLKMGVIFRPVAGYGLPGALRISLGTPVENRLAVKALKALVR